MTYRYFERFFLDRYWDHCERGLADRLVGEDNLRWLDEEILKAHSRFRYSTMPEKIAVGGFLYDQKFVQRWDSHGRMSRYDSFDMWRPNGICQLSYHPELSDAELRTASVVAKT